MQLRTREQPAQEVADSQATEVSNETSISDPSDPTSAETVADAVPAARLDYERSTQLASETRVAMSGSRGTGSGSRNRASVGGSSNGSSAHGSNGHGNGHFADGTAGATHSSASNGASASISNGNGTHAGTNGSTGHQNGSMSNGSNGHHTNGNSTSVDAQRPMSPGFGDADEADSLLGGPSTFAPLYDGSSIDRREFIRLTLQSLRELGFDSSARSLETESGVTLEHPSIVSCRSAIMAGDWKNAERLLIDGLRYSARRAAAATSPPPAASSSSSPDISVVLRDPSKHSLDSIKFLIYQQRYLELLESRQTRKALSVLRERLAPLNHGSDRLHSLSSLAMCASPEELRTRARWSGSGATSRRKLLEEIESVVSPRVMIPSRRLPQLLEQAQKLQTTRDPFFNLTPDARLSLYTDHRSDRSIFPSWPMAELRGHTDEIWHIAFSHDGTKLASTGKEKEAYIWSVGPSQDDFKIISKLGPLNGSICHAAWSPDNKHLLVTSYDGEVAVYDVSTGFKRDFRGHIYTAGCGCWMPDSFGFITCSMDGKVIFWNLDGTDQGSWQMPPFRVQAMDVSPDGRHLVAISHRPMSASVSAGPSSQLARSAVSPIESGALAIGGAGDWTMSPSSAGRHSDEWAPARSSAGSDAGGDVIDLGGGSRTLTDERFQIHFFDLQRREELGSVYMWDEMTSVQFSRDSRHVLINQRPNEAHLWDIARQSRVARFSGHQIKQFVVRSCFGGAGENFIVSGSEDGYVYVYHRRTGKLLERLRGHQGRSINSVTWHPVHRDMFASCGDDGKILIWRPPPTHSVSGVGQSAHALTTTTIDGTRNVSSSGFDGAMATGNGHGAGSAATLSGMTQLWLGYPRDAGASQSRLEGEDTSVDAMMGPSPFPWATSLHEPASPTLGGTRTRTASRRRGPRRVPATLMSLATGQNAATSIMQASMDEHDDDDDDEDEEDYNEEGEDVEEDEEEEEGEGEEDDNHDNDMVMIE